MAIALCGALLVCYIAFCVRTYGAAKGGYDSAGILIGHDFIAFWTAAALVHAGHIADIFSADTFNAWQLSLVGPVQMAKAGATVAPLSYPWLYPPPGLFPVLPFGFMDYFWAYGAWCVAGLALFLWAALGSRWRSPEGIALTLAPPTFACMLAGQNGLITGALLVGGLRVLERRPVLAGVLFGLMAFKPHLGILIPVALIAARQWRAFGAAAIAAALLYAASIPAFGLESWTAYFAGSTSRNYDGLLGDALGPFLNVSATPFIAARIRGADAAGRIAVQLAFTAAAAAGVWMAYRRPVDPALRGTILMTGVMLATPFGYFYDLPALGAAVLIAYREGLRTGFLTGERLVLVAAWLVPIVIVAVNKQGVPLGPVAILTLFGFLCARAFGWTFLGRIAPSPPASPS
jgi:hypothetical protein